jgi:hypothetical protein
MDQWRPDNPREELFNEYELLRGASYEYPHARTNAFVVADRGPEKGKEKEKKKKKKKGEGKER